MTGSASGPQVLTEEARLRTKRSSLIDQRIVFPSIQGARHSQCAPIMKCLDRERGHVSSSMTRGAAQYRDGDGVLTFGLFLKQQQLCINNSSELCTVCPCVDIRLACVLTNICLKAPPSKYVLNPIIGQHHDYDHALPCRHPSVATRTSERVIAHFNN